MSVPAQRSLVLHQKRPTDVVRVEKNLNTFGFFSPLHKRVVNVQEKRIAIFVREQQGQRAEAHATILPSAKFGLPTTADQDKYYAFQKLLDQRRKKTGVLANPITFTSAEMLKLLGRKKSGQGYKEISDWMERMTLTGIRSEGVIWLAGRKNYARDTFTVFSRTVTVGQELPDGRTADRNYVWLSDWQLENLNHSYVLPIDYDIYRSLRLNISKALVPLIQIWFYAARRNPNTAIEKRYSELCQLLSLRRYPHLSKIKEVLGPSLDELREHRVLRTWNIERTADREDYKLILLPGERFLNENRLKLMSREDGALPADPRVEALCRALTDRGVSADRARRVLADAPEGQHIEDQIEYGDFETKRRRSGGNPIANPPGFYIYLIENNFPVPHDFDTSRKRALRRLAQERDHTRRSAQANEDLKQQLLQDEYQTYREQEMDRYIAEKIPAEDLKKLIKTAKAELAKERSDFRLPEPAASQLALQRVKESLADRAAIMSFESFLRQRQLTLPL